MDLLKKELRVEELVNSIKSLLENNFYYVKVIGEISALKEASSGHLYFNLKENESLINAVLFKHYNLKNNFVLEDGLEVVVLGKLTTYISKSNYQIIIENVKINGEGQLQKIINERKNKLEKEGLFDKKYKKIIKTPIKSVGIITSPTGAAIKDIEVKLKDRLTIDAFLFPSLVQGNQAEKNIIKGIEFFNKNYKNLDAIVITRGGGSTEDLMCFNGEELARSIFNSQIPIISAIGHEVDWTIADYVSDLRLPTPTAVGEFLSPLKIECEKRLMFLFKRILIKVLNCLINFEKKVELLLKEIKFVIIKKHFIHREKLKLLFAKFEKFDRNKILKQGYALIEKNGKKINYKEIINNGDELIIKMYKRQIIVKVIQNKS